MLAAVLLAAPAQATDHDAQVWTSLTATAPMSKRVDVTLEAHGRFSDDVSRLGQLLLRPSATLKLPGGASVAVGYVYARTAFANTRTNEEHRSWQQVGYRLHENGRMRLTGRTRMEQRFRVGATDDVGWRLRQQLRVQAIRPGKVAPLVWNETFVQLNDTRWGARSGVDQVRTFVGASVPLNKALSIEPGYLNQTIFRAGPERVNHIALAALVARL